MKLTKTTLSVLKNFSNINPGIYFRAGKTITTRSPSKSILARFDGEDEFPADFAIAKLSKFLGLLSTFDEPEIEIESMFARISEGKRSARIVFTEPHNIEYPAKDHLSLSDCLVEGIRIEPEHLTQLNKSLAIMELPEVAIMSDGSKVCLAAVDSQNGNGDRYAIEIGETNKEFSIFFKTANLKMITAPYVFRVSSAGVAEFKNDSLCYWVAAEKNSVIPKD